MKSDLRQVVLTGASLSSARFLEVDLPGVDMTGAALDKATFTCAPCRYHEHCPESACNPFTGALRTPGRRAARKLRQDARRPALPPLEIGERRYLLWGEAPRAVSETKDAPPPLRAAEDAPPPDDPKRLATNR